MGVAGMLVILPVLKAWDPGVKRDSERGALKDVIFLAVMIMLTTGIKGPMAVVIVGGLIGTVLLGLIMRKLSWKVIPPTVIATAAFIFIYIYVVGARGVSQTNGHGGTLLNPWEVTDIFFLKNRILDLFPSRTMGLPALLLCFVLMSLTAFAVPFIIGYIRELFLVLSGRKDFCLSKVTVYASCLVGYLALLLLNYSGHSQVYFGFASLILVPVIAFWYLEDLERKGTSFAKVIKAIFIIFLCLTALTAAQDMYRMAGNAQRRYEKRDKESQVYRAVSSSEYEGLIWLRDNTDDDSLIASDRYYSVSLDDYSVVSRSHNTHFAYAIYSERDQYLEGSGFSLTPDEYELRREMIHNVNDMMDAENDERGDLARSLDVDYVLVSKRFNDAGDLSNEDYQLVYTNDEIDIYEVLDEAA